jgi:hypothetical protein
MEGFMRKLILLLVTLAVETPVGAAPNPTTYNWYRFRKDFITANYQGGVAVGSLAAKHWAAAKNAHSIDCGGSDGELHIGIFDSGLDPGNPEPSAPEGDATEWGVVAELPNSADGDGQSVLNQHSDSAAVFSGYFRVWDEGHSVGAVHPSNPHHVFEVHPAWGFKIDGGPKFDRKDLIDSMSGFRGFGATIFKPLFQHLDDGDWPMVYQDDTYLYVRLIKASNFFQLPIIVQAVNGFQDGHIASVDVYSDSKFKTVRHEGLRCISVTGSGFDDQWAEGDKAFVLGLFSVNLKKALDAAGAASSESDAVAAPDALEFFVFGRATSGAIATCSK